MKKNKIGLFGIGAIGSVLSFKLDETINEFYYYNRSQKREIKIIEEQKVERREITLSPISRENEEALDWLIICLKEYQIKEAETAISHLIGAATKIAVIRNGINLKEPFLKFVSETRIVACMIDCPTQINENGVYHQLRKPIITLKKNELSKAFKTLFIKDKIEIIQVVDFKAKNWEKLIESSAIGGILALSGESCWIFKDVEMVELFKRIVAEGISVAEAEGVKFADDYKTNLVKKLLTYPATKESSMLIDRRKGNPIELNAKNAIIAQLGKKHGIKTTLNDLISLLLRYTNRREVG